MRWSALALLAACGHSGAKPDSPLPIDARVSDCELPVDSYFVDSAPQQPGTQTFNIEIADELADPTGNWVLVGIDKMNMTVTAIQDSVSGQATTINLTSTNWNVQDGNASNWTAGNQGWLQAVAAQDTWGASVGNA